MNTELILEQLFDLGYATKNIEIGKKIKIELKSLSAKDYLDIDPILSAAKGTKLFVLQSYGIAKLSRALKSYNKMVFTDPEKTKSFLETLPAALIDKMIKEHAELEKEISLALNPETVKKNSLNEPGSDEKQEQSLKELVLESPEV